MEEDSAIVGTCDHDYLATGDMFDVNNNNTTSNSDFDPFTSSNTTNNVSMCKPSSPATHSDHGYDSSSPNVSVRTSPAPSTSPTSFLDTLDYVNQLPINEFDYDDDMPLPDDLLDTDGDLFDSLFTDIFTDDF